MAINFKGGNKDVFLSDYLILVAVLKGYWHLRWNLLREGQTTRKCNKREHSARALMSVEDLVVRIRIEEETKLAKKSTYTLDSAKANMVEHAGSSSKSNSKASAMERMTRRAKGRLSTLLANMVNDNMDMIAIVSDVIVMISEVNLVVDNGEKLYIGNSATADIKGEGDVILKMTSEKEIKLTNIVCKSDSIDLVSV
ncbi:hypothetical protein Tco_1116026 [Tanacetum coccineum]